MGHDAKMEKRNGMKWVQYFVTPHVKRETVCNKVSKP